LYHPDFIDKNFVVADPTVYNTIRKIYMAESETVTVKETSAFRTFERKIVRKIYGSVEEGEQNLENGNKHGDEGRIAGGR
jgi:hypothetical protein